MFCSNCGAELKESDVTCPYCGMLQPAAAESEYMQKLEHLKQDVQNLKAVPTKEYTRELRHQGIFTAKIVLISFLYLSSALRNRGICLLRKQLSGKERTPKRKCICKRVFSKIK